jgi:hypothetical protein
VPHVLPISVFLTWSPEWYLVRSTEHAYLLKALKVDGVGFTLFGLFHDKWPSEMWA